MHLGDDLSVLPARYIGATAARDHGHPGGTPGPRQPADALRIENHERRIGILAVQDSPDELLRFFVLVGLNPDANELARNFNKLLRGEQTVLRFGVARSEHA